MVLDLMGLFPPNSPVVDFRALDTLGEITVLAIAALGVFAMLRLRPGRGGKEDR